MILRSDDHWTLYLPSREVLEFDTWADAAGVYMLVMFSKVPW